MRTRLFASGIVSTTPGKEIVEALIATRSPHCSLTLASLHGASNAVIGAQTIIFNRQPCPNESRTRQQRRRDVGDVAATDPVAVPSKLPNWATIFIMIRQGQTVEI